MPGLCLRVKESEECAFVYVVNLNTYGINICIKYYITYFVAFLSIIFQCLTLCTTFTH